MEPPREVTSSNEKDVPTIELKKDLAELTELETERIISRTNLDEETSNLTKKDIQKDNLAPKYEIVLDPEKNIKAYLPDGHLEINNKPFTIAYIELNQEVRVNTYYLSGTQGVWRLLPHYYSGLSYADKGYAENSLTIPPLLQKSLAHLIQTPHDYSPDLATITREDDFIPLPYTKKLTPPHPRNYLQIDLTSQKRYQKEVSQHPLCELNNKLSGGFEGNKNEPEEIIIEQNQSPDFSTTTLDWSQWNPLYGLIHYETFSSHDKSLNYIFCSDSEGRIWIGGVEDSKAEITSTGVRSKWIETNDLTTPSLEYNAASDRDQTGGYGFQWALRKYDEMQSYLNQIPIISQYRTRNNIVYRPL